MAEPIQFKITLASETGLRDANSFRDHVAKALREHSAIEIDVKDAQSIDISIVQVLISAQKTAASLGRSFVVTGPPNNHLKTVLERGGFVRRAGSPSAAA